MGPSRDDPAQGEEAIGLSDLPEEAIVRVIRCGGSRGSRGCARGWFQSAEAPTAPYFAVLTGSLTPGKSRPCSCKTAACGVSSATPRCGSRSRRSGEHGPRATVGLDPNRRDSNCRTVGNVCAGPCFACMPPAPPAALLQRPAEPCHLPRARAAAGSFLHANHARTAGTPPLPSRPSQLAWLQRRSLRRRLAPPLPLPRVAADRPGARGRPLPRAHHPRVRRRRAPQLGDRPRARGRAAGVPIQGQRVRLQQRALLQHGGHAAGGGHAGRVHRRPRARGQRQRRLQSVQRSWGWRGHQLLDERRERGAQRGGGGGGCAVQAGRSMVAGKPSRGARPRMALDCLRVC